MYAYLSFLSLFLASFAWAQPTGGPIGPFTGSWVDVSKRGLACDHSVDVTTALQNIIDEDGVGTIFLPTGCKLLLAGPGAGNTAISLPSGKSIYCADNTAGFWLASRRCDTGTLTGAWCTADADCQICSGCGSATCRYDDQSGLAVFAPTADSKYTVIKVAADAVNNKIERCGFFTNGLNPFLSCDSGTNSGKPCQQYCSGGTVAGSNCRIDSDCAGGGTCQQRDCTLGTTEKCINLSGARPVGDGDVTVVDSVSSSMNTTIKDITIYDLARSQGAITTQENSVIQGVVMDCSRVIEGNYTSPSVGSPKMLCWPAIQLSPLILNATPTLAIDAAVTVDTGSTVSDNALLATTTGIVGASSSIIERNVIPPDGGNNYYTGSGAFAFPATGIDVGSMSQVRLRANVISATDIGISLGTSSLADGNRITATGTGDIGFRVIGNQDRITSNHIAAFWGIVMVPTGAINNTVLGNHLYTGAGAKVVLTGAGHRVVGNYIAWNSGDGGLCAGGANAYLACSSGGDCPSSTCTPDPVIWVGSPDHGLSDLSTSNVIDGVSHVVIEGNELYTNSTASGTALVKIADTGKLCVGGATPGQYCTGGDCGAGTCTTNASSAIAISNNSMLAADVGINLTGINSTTHTVNGLQAVGNLYTSNVDLAMSFPSTGLTNFLGAGNALNSAAATVTGWSSTFGTLQGQTNVVFNAGGCNVGTSSPSFDLASGGGAATTACLGSSATPSGVLSFATGVDRVAYAHVQLPKGWIKSAGIDVVLTYSGDSTNTNNIRWRVSTACKGDGEDISMATGTGFNTADSNLYAYPGTANFRKTATILNINTQSTSACDPEETLFLKVERVGTSDSYTGNAYLFSTRLTFWRAI